MAGSNWQQLAGGSVNPYDIRRDDGTPTADYGEHIISDGGTVTLPSPKADKAVLVSNISQDTTVTTSTGLVEQQSDVTHLSSVSDPVLFVSDGSNWYVANNLDYLRNIPDSGVFRYDFENTSSTSNAVDSFDNNPINLSLNGPTYSTNARFGSNSLDYDGSGDTADTDTFGGINSHTFSAFVFPTDLSVTRSVGLFLDGGERSFVIRSDGSVGWGGGTNAGFFSTSSGVVSTGTYTHIMWYYDDSNGERRIYVDNQLEAQDTDSEATLNNTNHRIGYGNTSPTNPFVGQLDRVDFYEKPLSSTERSNLYNNGNI